MTTSVAQVTRSLLPQQHPMDKKETSPFIANDIYAHHGRHLMRKILEQRHKSALDHKGRFPESKCSYKNHGHPTVGVLGAGMGGLYAALILQSLDIEYEILEANDRIGGRAFTHQFEKGMEYDYFEVGAMRFPHIKCMERLFHLVRYDKLNEGEDPLAGRLIPYFFEPKDNNALSYFNGVRERQAKGMSENFRWKELGVGEKYIKATPDAILKDVMGTYAAGLEKDLRDGEKNGWNELMKMDAYSARGYMSMKYEPEPSFGFPDKHLPTAVVNWCETLENSTGSYDRSFPEMVLEVVAFGEDLETPPNWSCFDRGTRTLPNFVEWYLINTGGKIHLNNCVTRIAHDKKNNKMVVDVLSEGKVTPRTFDHVISTIPLPVMRTLDLQDSGMDIAQTNALRQLTYGPTTKIGMLFKTAWWTTGKDRDGKLINLFGGQSSTDLPVRTVVYPSYGSGRSSTLITSYCWTDDAQRFGGLMGTGKKENEDRIKAIVIRDLALVHNVDHEWLEEQYVEHFAWDWHHPQTLGGFAFFGPGMFEEPYQSLTVPASHGRLHFAGEALSVRHAWIVGALDSAWRAVKEILVLVYGPSSEQVKKFHEMWGYNEEWTPVPAVPNQDGDDFGDDLLLRHLLFNRPEVFNEPAKRAHWI
ncbi:hypothetical protein BD779DRAFT_1560216 [Infundibulicybe gibba]|nr:hypothetical protein BD779DRAFT_1560216 [Infundibulicybe gibba]